MGESFGYSLPLTLNFNSKFSRPFFPLEKTSQN